MSLRVLSLRGLRPPYDEALPRPDDPGADVYEAVADIVRRVRTEGDAAVAEFTKRFDRVDVSGTGLGGMRVPPDQIEAALERGRRT
jgi:histidinol dehydrogenase